MVINVKQLTRFFGAMFRDRDDEPVEDSEEESSSSAESFEETINGAMVMASGAVDQETRQLEEAQSAYDISLPARHLVSYKGGVLLIECDPHPRIPFLPRLTVPGRNGGGRPNDGSR